MDILFLSERNLAVLDHAYATDDFEIVLDALVPQKSTFNINKKNINAGIGDYLAVKDRNYFYIGIIAAIDEDKKATLKVSTRDFLSKFDVKVPVSSFDGNISQFLINLINNHFKYSGDPSQNLPYLVTEIECSKSGALSYEDDETANIIDLAEEFSKTYGIRLAYELVIANGAITNIRVKAVSVVKGVKLRSDLGTITNLVISDTNEASANKITYYPKSDNAVYRSTISYYLYNDGTVSTVAASDKRITPVVFKSEKYSDNDYPSLLTKATSALIDSSLEHSITFDFAYSINKIEALNDLSLGTYVEFVSPKKTYSTLITKITYKGTFNAASLVLGEYRATLTDKLKLLNRKEKQHGTN